MPTKYWRGIVVASVALGWVTLAHCLGGRGAAEPKAAPAEQAKGGPTPRYFGAKVGCGDAGCHTSAPNPDDFFLCRCTEYPLWSKEDKHAKAYTELLGAKAQRMGELLGYKEKVQEKEECLACHGAVIKDAELKDDSFDPKEGVNCVLCHGAYEEWISKHSVFVERKKWRKLSHREKQEKFGLTDLWTPTKRTALCASCHIGDLTPGQPPKFVTHEMYAAGHPPLPGFEAATFSEQMPRHWDHLREKQKKLTEKFHKKPAEVKELIGYDGKDEERTKLVLVSAAVSLRESMRLLARQAEDCVKAVEPDQRALNLSNFDCYACHHDLKSPSWRQKRGYTGKPGRVPMRPWPTALVKLAIRHAADKDAEEMESVFAKKWQRLQTAFEVKPFGDPKTIAPAADDLAKWANTLAEKLERKPCDKAAARKLLAQLPSLFKGATPDYDSARQIAWAFQVMYGELENNPDPRIQKVLESLKKELKLDLPSGQKRNISEELVSGLERLNSYNPDDFKKALATLAASMNGK